MGLATSPHQQDHDNGYIGVKVRQISPYSLPSHLFDMAMSLCGFRQSVLVGRRTLTSQYIRRASTLPHTIRPSRDEVAAGRLSSRNLEAAVRSLHLDGLVVVSDVIQHSVLDHLNAKMVEDARILQARGKDGPFNYNVGNIVGFPP